MSLLRTYDSYLIRRPLATKMATNFTICCAGDLICQAIVSQASKKQDQQQQVAQTEIDLVRTARFGTVGACVQTTLLHWYLSRVVPRLEVGPHLL